MTELPGYRVSSSEDVMAHFQTRLDRLPQGVFSEFGAVLVGDAEKIDRLIFPGSIVGIRDADEALAEFSLTAFPDVRLAAEVETDAIYLKISCQVPNEFDAVTTNTLIVDIGRSFFAYDIWDAISAEGQSHLSRKGFGPNMTAQQWAVQINTALTDIAPSAALAGDEKTLLMLRELPIPILRRGVLGTNGSYHFMPEFMLHALTTNSFKLDVSSDNAEPVSCFGNVHVHSLVNEMGDLERAVANIVGADVVRRNPSAPDIMHHRASNDIFQKVSCRYGAREAIDAMYTFGGIVTVDGGSKATGVRWWDLCLDGLDLSRLVRLNDAAYDELAREHADARVIAEYYSFVDSMTTAEMPVYAR